MQRIRIPDLTSESDYKNKSLTLLRDLSIYFEYLDAFSYDNPEMIAKTPIDSVYILSP